MRRTSFDRTLNRMVKRLVKHFDPDQIILFGSHARGTANADSDIDLLVVLSLQGSKRVKQIEMRVALNDMPVPKDILVVTPEELRRYRNVPGTIVYPALREGRVLYARP